MKILAIETSCDETAIAILSAKGGSASGGEAVKFEILSNQVLSQIKIHKKFGGVVPNLAMREHRKNLPVILKKALDNLTPAPLLRKKRGVKKNNPLPPYKGGRGQGGKGLFFSAQNKIDAIAVTHGPGLEPALWEGINFAKGLAKKWQAPLVPVNHLEGHIYASWLPTAAPSSTSDVKSQKTSDVFPGAALPKFPLLALIVSGGHTELVLMKKHLDYKILGATRDDAAGEAFDKVARMLGLGYPGGPEIAKLAKPPPTPSFVRRGERNNPLPPYEGARGQGGKGLFPRPMINSGDFDFSFSGLKTAVLYYLRDNPRADKAAVAYEFQQAVVDVLVKKTADALRHYGVGHMAIKSLVVGGGVAANQALRHALGALIKNSFPKVSLHVSPLWLCGDNAAMIAVAGYFKYLNKKFASPEKIKAQGGLKL